MTEADAITVRHAKWPDESESLRRLRESVFVQGQGVPVEIEWDGQDAAAEHVIALLGDVPVGCGRLLPDGRIGRLAVLAAHRGSGIGALLLSELLGIARRRGESRLYLHAQAAAVEFYQRAGFKAQGEPFDEAGIQHLDMHLELDYCDWNEAVSGLRYPQPFDQLVIAQARLARRELRILSPQLDPRVFGQEALESSLRKFLRQGAATKVNILVEDARALVSRGHRLLQLARRLPSSVEIRRLAEHPDWNGDTLVLRDRRGMLALPASETDPAFYRPDDRPRCEAELARFEDLWRVASIDPEFRALSI